MVTRLSDSLTEKNHVFLTNYLSVLKYGYYEKLTHQTQIKTPPDVYKHQIHQAKFEINALVA